MRSPVGAILRAIRDNPLRAAAVGHDIQRYKLTAFVVAAAYAGFAGGLLGVMQGFMPPDAFTFDTSGQLVMQTAIGGAGTLFGPLVGAAIWLYLSDFFQNTLHLGSAWKLVLGVVFVLLVDLPAPRRHRRLRGPDRRSRSARCEARDEAPESGPDGRAIAAEPRVFAAANAARRRRRRDRATSFSRRRQLTRRYGGLVANRDIDFSVRRGRDARHHRPERRRQEHVLQDADLRSASDLRADPVRGPRHHRLERDTGLPARPDEELSGQPTVQQTHRP